MIKLVKKWYKTRSAIMQYGDYYRTSKIELCKLIWYYTMKKHHRVATWGAGFKGLAFLSTVDCKGRYIHYVIDVNNDLHGTKLITGQTVISSDQIKNKDIDVILVMNSNFYAEIYMELQSNGYKGLLIDIDHMIINQLSAKQVVKANIKKS